VELEEEKIKEGEGDVVVKRKTKLKRKKNKGGVGLKCVSKLRNEKKIKNTYLFLADFLL